MALSPTQNKFLSALFGSHIGNAKSASKDILGTEDYSSLMTDELISEIKKRGDKEIAMSVPRAIHVISRLLEDPESAAFADKLHKIAADVLDRAGISKQERTSSSQVAIGIVLLPSKVNLPEPPTIEQNSVIHGPMLLTSPIKVNVVQT